MCQKKNYKKISKIPGRQSQGVPRIGVLKNILDVFSPLPPIVLFFSFCHPFLPLSVYGCFSLTVNVDINLHMQLGCVKSAVET